MADINPYTACREGDLETLCQILSRDKIDVNKRYANGKTLAMVAAENNNNEVFDFLVSEGYDLSIVDDRKRNILHVSSTGGNAAITKFILSKQIVDLNIRDKEEKTAMMLAAERGHRAVFLLLVQAGSDLTLTDCEGNGVLHLACSGGSIEIVEYLLSQKSVALNGPNLHGITPIMVTSRHGHKHLFDRLVEQGGDVTTVDEQGRTTLHAASQGGNVDIVEYILAKDKGALNKRDSEKRTPVMITALNANREVFYLLVTQGCSLSGVGSDGNTIIHLACIGGSVEIVEYILAQEDIDIDKKGQSGVTPLMMAARKGFKQVFDVLAFRKCDLSCIDDRRNNILHHAVLGGNVDIVQYLVTQDGIDINSQGRYGMTSVMMATLNGHDDVFDLLVSKGCNMYPVCDFNYNVLHIACLTDNHKVADYILSNEIIPATSRGRHDRTPMMMAADQGHMKIFDLFVNKGCDFSIIDGHGLNILHIACIGGNVDIVKYITSLNIIDVNGRSGHFGRTAVMIAAERNRKEVFDFLVRKGCNLSLEDEYGNNVLHSACVGGGLQMVEYILEQNVLDMNKESKVGDSPIRLAASNDHNDIVDLLKRRGCKEQGCVIA